MLNLRAEAQLPSLHHRISQLTDILVDKMAHSSRLYSVPERVLIAANDDPVLFTWARCAVATLSAINRTSAIKNKGADVLHLDHTPAPPWNLPLPNIIDN